MGDVYAEIKIENNSDVADANRERIEKKDIRSVTVKALIDTGATTLVINEGICGELGLSFIGTRTASLAGGEKALCKITEPVVIHWKNRVTVAHAWVLPGDDETLLGVIPLEDMDLIVDPVRRELTGAHGDEIMGRIK